MIYMRNFRTVRESWLFAVCFRPMKGSAVEKYAHDALQFIFPKNCFEELIINFNVFHPTCPKMVLSRVLGIGITAGSILLFVPQIIKIFNGKSAKGISLISQLLALVAAAGTASYSFNKGFVFSQWGDSFFVSVQLMIIVMQILYYSDARTIARVFTSIQDTGDSLLIVSFAIAAVLNAVLFVQFFLYWNEVKRKKMR
ncbi:PQ loop repeat protein [Ostertagia ostertagi]